MEKNAKNGTEPQQNATKLPEHFRLSQHGTTRTLDRVFENDGWYIYHAHETHSYEVFKKKVVQRLDYRDGKFIKLDAYKESYPNDEDFGTWAWCCSTLDRAMKYAMEEKKKDGL